MKSLLVIFLSLAIAMPAFSEGEEDLESIDFSRGQKIVLGTTAVLLLGSLAATHEHHAAEGRKTILTLGALAFIGVTIYDQSNKKLEVGVKDGDPALSYSYHF